MGTAVIGKLEEEQRRWYQTRVCLGGGEKMNTKWEHNEAELAWKNPTGNFTVKRKGWEQE